MKANSDEIISDLLKIVSIIDNAYSNNHIEVAIKMIDNFVNKWQLHSVVDGKRFIDNKIVIGLYEKVENKKATIYNQEAMVA